MKKNYLLYTFVISILGIFFIDLIEPKKNYSDLEKRNLKTNVTFKYKDFFSGKFSKDYEQYINDQFFGRDNWISLKGLSEKSMLKLENNNILLGKEDFLFSKYFKIDNYRKNYNVQSLKEFEKNYNKKISFMLVPNSYEVYKENLKGSPPLINQQNEINKIYSELDNINTIQLLDKYNTYKNQYIYYKTDHHWTINGAYLAYEEFVKSRNMTAIDIRNKGINIENFFGSYYSKAKPILNSGDVLTYIPLDNISMKINNVEFNSLYNTKYLDESDKYSVYLNGNNSYTEIKNLNLKNNKKLLVIKDSFANSMIPFLTSNYEEIFVIDLRSFGDSIKEYINNNTFDDVLIVYNFENFCLDSNFLKIKN